MSTTQRRSRIRANKTNSSTHTKLPHTLTRTSRLSTTRERRVVVYMTPQSRTPEATIRTIRPCRNTIRTILTRC